MNEQQFWDLIDASNKQSHGNQDTQIQFLQDTLVKLEENDIFAFENIFRQKVLELDDYKIIAINKIVEGYVSDDTFLYFRCWLISQGKSVFLNTLTHPDSLANFIKTNQLKDDVFDCESLMYVATEAFSVKTNKEEDDTFPRDVSIKNNPDLDYDFGKPPTKGQDWKEEELPEMYPQLWRLFNH